jgi:SsrA-binding protein
MAARKTTGEELIADNRKAHYDYHLLESFEAGLALLGTEVKAMRERRANLRDSFCRFERGEAYLFNAHVGQYSHGGSASHDPLRSRKLLLHAEELRKLLGKTSEKGLTIVPLKLYFKNGRVKLAIALAKGKKSYDKRETIKRRESERETRVAMKTRGRG